ncbi:hypothetical protein A8924_4759 [Saccharopolyspora erythraea NRRL 2338]|uniref:PH domain-containing protein n=1 Tax=Saccharopolyspora erythraea TaxID=1836 RepID=A0ABN1C3V2_SACER|nr:hypothetical protein N599_20835 [Saccharopolyspora erythraea D]PFG97326.1 hypothetical protein A8924_4759 [Saccharopolyspora erythraea NRRL 2338]
MFVRVGEENGLGALVDRFAVDGARRVRIAAVLLVVGLVTTVLFVVLAIPAYANSVTGDDVVPSVGLGAGVGLLLLGGWQGWLSLARRGESFQLHEGGLVHSYSGREVRAVRWDDVADITDHAKDTALARLLGGDVNCRIKPTGGKAVVITGLVDGAEHLVSAVRRAVEDRPPHPRA